MIKKQIDRYRKVFYDVKTYENTSIPKIKKASKSLTKLKKSLRFKKFRGDIDSVNYEDLDNYDYNYDFDDDNEYREIGSIRTLFKELDRDYYTNTNTNSNRAGWKIQLIMQNNFIFVKDFEDTRTIYSASKPVEIFMGSDTENIIDTLFDTILNRIQEAMVISNERGSGFTYENVVLLYYHFQRIDIRRGGSYIAPPD